MSEFKELVKSFAKSREYVRDFFVYGFKTREDFQHKSARTYDNERRRIESWLSGFVRQDYTEQGKNISLAIDTNLLDTNPLYRVFKTKSFTDNDILLHFFLLDYLSQGSSDTADAITDAMVTRYHAVFDVQIVRRKCNDYVKEGLLTKEKRGKEITYKIKPDFTDTLLNHPGLAKAISYYQLVAPMGVIGSTLMDSYELTNDLFRVKHGFCVHALEDEILLALLTAMRTHMSVMLHMQSTKNHGEHTLKGVPMQIFVSTRSGRRFLCVYLRRAKRFHCIRLDAIKKVENAEVVSDYDELLKLLIKNHDLIWGVSFQNLEQVHRQWVRMTLHIEEPSEHFIVNRLKQEGRGGTITQINQNTYVYEKEVFDANEMMPWVRTFIGRIIDFSSSSKQLEERFYRDLQAMYQMYGIERLTIKSQV